VSGEIDDGQGAGGTESVRYLWCDNCREVKEKTEVVAGRVKDDVVTVHILRFGFALCRFSMEVPRDWPDGHAWLSVADRLVEEHMQNSNRFHFCVECISMFRGE